MTLMDSILRLANLWAAAKGHTSTSRLSTIVANDGGLLKRLADGGGSTTVTTLDKFAVFLREPANWPDETPPDEARDLISALPHIATPPALAEEPLLPFAAPDEAQAA